MIAEQTWLDRCVRGSFRGFEFLTDSHTAQGGRRLVVHEYPGADEPRVEDMGGKAWDWKLNAYFIGPNYDLERNGFMALLAESGADWLTHPWLGDLWVRPHTWSLSESNDKGAYCSLSISFVPGGEQPYEVEVDRVDVAFERIQVFADVSAAEFALEPMSANGLTSFIAAVHGKLEVLRTVLSLATLPLTWARQVIGLVQSVKSDIAALLALPGAYPAALLSLSNALGFGSAVSDADRADVAQRVAVQPGVAYGGGQFVSSVDSVAATSDIADTDRPRVVRLVAAIASSPAPVLSGLGATDPVVRRNVAAEDVLRKRLIIAAAAQIAMADYRVEADRDSALASVIAAIDAALPGMSDPVFQAALAMRVAVINALMAQDLQPAQQRDVVSPLPAVVLAHRLEIDEDVLIARNRIRHPLFVQGRVYG